MCLHIVELRILGAEYALGALQHILRTLWTKYLIVALFALGEGGLQEEGERAVWWQ